MRLVGYEFSDVDGPVPEGFLPLGDVTVLVGANDVGKSRLLRAVADGARSLDALLENKPFHGNHRFFAKLHPDDARQLIRLNFEHHLNELRAAGMDEEADLEASEGKDAWLAYLPPDARALEPAGSTFAFEALADWCGKPRGGDPGLLVSWCRDARPLARSGRFNAGERAVLFGTLQVPILPVAVQVPVSEPRWLVQEVGAAMTAWLSHVQWALRQRPRLAELATRSDDPEVADQWIDIADSFNRQVENPVGFRTLWTVEDEQATSYRPIALTGCAFASEIATRLAPEFIRERYSLRISPVPILEWDDEAPIALSLCPKDGDGAYLVEDAADGLRLWIDMAIIEAADAMRRVELNLRHALTHIEHARDAAAIGRAAEAYLSLLQEAISSAVDPAFDRSVGSTLALALGLESPFRDEVDPASEVARRVMSARARLYLLDEPERHLNPRLQRVAAKWLVDLLESRRSQGLIATHSSAFLSVGASPTYVTVRRRGSHAQLETFEPEQLTAYSEIAEEVGWDRGELLTSVRLLAFVEGRHDQVVLEELFSVPFHHAGIVVVPIAGVGRHPQIVEHDVLLRFTRARLAVVFDKLDRKTIDRLLVDTSFREESLRSGSTEAKAMASLLHRAHEHGREVIPVPLPVGDIFDALDEEILCHQFPRFPGHADANAAWGAERKKIPNRKKHYEDRFGIPNELATYRTIAALMRGLDRVPDALSDLGTQLELLAAEFA